jgi:hypothetical protein
MNLRCESARAGSTLSKAVLSILLAILFALAPSPARWDGSLSSLACAAPARGAKGKKARKDFQYSVSDCLESDKMDSVALEVSASSVTFRQTLTMNCIAATRPSTVKVTHAKKGRDLQVVVILETDVLSQCTCPIGIEGTIYGLGKGAHRISFTYDFKPGSALNEKPTRQSLGSKEFSIE